MTRDLIRHRDPNADVAVRVSDLLARMTLAEKLAQLGSAWVFQLADPHGFDAQRAVPVLNDGIGHVTRVCGASGFTAAEAAAFNNALQQHLREHTRLGIIKALHIPPIGRNLADSLTPLHQQFPEGLSVINAAGKAAADSDDGDAVFRHREGGRLGWAQVG